MNSTFKLNEDEEHSRKRVKVEDKKRATTTTLVVCVGLPGSGKSTFCSELEHQLLAAGEYKLTILCQDVLGKSKCLTGCKAALLACSSSNKDEEQQHSVIVVDRTNMDPKQRSIWLELASKQQQQDQCQIIAVDFTLDAATCMERAKLRTNHPTLSANKVGMVVGMLKKRYQPPTVDEGFFQVFTGADSMELAKQVSLFMSS